jgi:hypothetical protein
MIGFLAFGNYFPAPALRLKECPSCGARIRLTPLTIGACLGTIALLFAWFVLADRLASRFGIVERFWRGALAVGGGLPGLVALGWAIWSHGKFVVREPLMVNGLPLPGELVALMQQGRWKAPSERSEVDRLFPENGGLCLYQLDGMVRETRTLFSPHLQGPMWLGVPDSNHHPGDIDPRLAVLIADLGIGYDQPIALDYRPSIDRPSVITLRWSERGDENRWILVAPDIEEFARMVLLGE